MEVVGRFVLASHNLSLGFFVEFSKTIGLFFFCLFVLSKYCLFEKLYFC